MSVYYSMDGITPLQRISTQNKDERFPQMEQDEVENRMMKNLVFTLPENLDAWIIGKGMDKAFMRHQWGR
jgi:hypothetical protein